MRIGIFSPREDICTVTYSVKQVSLLGEKDDEAPCPFPRAGLIAGRLDIDVLRE